MLGFGVLALMPGVSAQTLLGGAEVSKKFVSGINLSASVEYRTSDWFDHSDQWSAGLSASYKPLKPLRVAAGYEFIQSHQFSGADAWWVNKHRVSVGVTGQWKPLAHLTLSLRERYQYTYRPETTVGLSDGVSNRTVSSKSKHVLRSRLQAEYKPYKKCRFTPYASFELYSLMADVNHTKDRRDPAKFCDKWRVAAGTQFKINKHNELELFYRYADTDDPDEIETHHTIGLKYSFSL